MEYKTYKLGTCFSLIENGAIIKQRKEAKGFPITRIETLSHGKFNRDKLGHADIFDTTPYKRYILEDKDLIMSHINSRAFLGRTVLYRKKGNEQIIHGMNVLRIKTNEQFLDPVFASYLFKTSHFKKAIDSIRKDAINQSSINIFDICNIQISLPSITEQRKISHALQLIDKKIETNHLINDNLEAMAKQLYEYWFVQFDFPNEEGKPYKSSGGAMVWNEKLKREIPQGWNILPISDILDKYPTTKRYETKEYLQIGKYPIIDQGDAYIVGFTNENDNLLTRHPAVLFGDHSTKVKFLDFDFARGADGTQILYSSNDAVSQYYLYLVVSALQIPNPGYSRHFKYLKELPIVIPSLSIATKFVNIVKPLFEKWTKNIFNNIALTKQRDELLPLLMNGQASVNYHLSSTPTTAFGMINKASTGIIGTAKFDMD